MKTLALLLTCALAGCLAPGDDPATDDTDPAATATPEAPVAVPTALRMHADVNPDRIASGPAEVDSYVSDCTYIQWCNAPGPEKIVCVLKPSCVDLCHSQQGYDSVISQCQNDATYVCGNRNSITYQGCYR